MWVKKLRSQIREFGCEFMPFGRLGDDVSIWCGCQFLFTKLPVVPKNSSKHERRIRENNSLGVLFVVI